MARQLCARLSCKHRQAAQASPAELLSVLSGDTERAVLRGLYGLSDLARIEKLEPTDEQYEEAAQEAVSEGAEDSIELRRFLHLEIMVRACCFCSSQRALRACSTAVSFKCCLPEHCCCCCRS